MAAWLELCHDIIEYGVYAEFGPHRGFAADSDIMMTTSPDVLSRAHSLRKYKENWSFSRSNTYKNGMYSPNYFITPEKSTTPQDKPRHHWKNKGNIISPDKSIPECNTETENQDPNIIKTCKSSKAVVETFNR